MKPKQVFMPKYIKEKEEMNGFEEYKTRID